MAPRLRPPTPPPEPALPEACRSAVLTHADLDAWVARAVADGFTGWEPTVIESRVPGEYADAAPVVWLFVYAWIDGPEPDDAEADEPIEVPA